MCITLMCIKMVMHSWSWQAHLIKYKESNLISLYRHILNVRAQTRMTWFLSTCALYKGTGFLIIISVEDTPEEVVSNAHIADGPPQQKTHQVTVQITLVLQRLLKEKVLESSLLDGKGEREKKGQEVKNIGYRSRSMGKDGIEWEHGRKLDTRSLLPALTEEENPKAQDLRLSPSIVPRSACTPDLETWDIKVSMKSKWTFLIFLNENGLLWCSFRLLCTIKCI